MKRSKFSLSNFKLLSCNMGNLVPIGVLEVLAGDSIQQSTSALIRAAPLLAPVMHRVDVRIHHWFVPNRIIWEDWETFITGGPDGNDSSEYPTIDMGGSGAAVGSLADYLGVPTGVANLEVSALPFRAYNLIFNEWYRDEDLVSELALSLASGADSTTATDLVNCAWEKDYFTSARPWEQKGPDITVPLGTSAPVSGIGFEGAQGDLQHDQSVRDSDGSDPTYADAWQDSSTASNNPRLLVRATTDAATTRPDVYADLSAASAVTVNTLRQALALQRIQEARARYGSRYVEYLRFLGVRSSDARLQRPEYLGGGKQAINFSEVLQTAEGSNPVGEMRGHGISAMRSNRYRRFFEEHGWVISVMSVRPKSVYMQGLFRHWNRRTKEDFWQKELQHIGQQPILNKELYADHSTPEGTFGYQDRYDEYRRQESSVSGEFRQTELNFWHMARDFSGDPTLNGDFVECVPTERTFAVPSEDVIYAMCRHSIQARRLVAKTGSSFIF